MLTSTWHNWHSHIQDQVRRIRDFNAGFGLTLPEHRMTPIMAQMENQLASIVSQLPDRIPDLIVLLTEPPMKATEETDDDLGQSTCTS